MNLSPMQLAILKDLIEREQALVDGKPNRHVITYATQLHLIGQQLAAAARGSR